MSFLRWSVMSTNKSTETSLSRATAFSNARQHSGRPPVLCEEVRRERILDSAESVLQKYGYRGASMDKIARHSGMSKKTLYTMFSSKQEMIEHLLHDRLMLADLQNLKLKGDTVESQLIFGLKALRSALMKEKRLSLLRLVIGETSRSHEADQVVRDFFSGASAVFPLKMWLRRLKQEGTLAITDVETASDMLFGFALASELLSELLHCRTNHSYRDHDAYVAATVQAFLRVSCQDITS